MDGSLLPALLVLVVLRSTRNSVKRIPVLLRIRVVVLFEPERDAIILIVWIERTKFVHRIVEAKEQVMIHRRHNPKRLAREGHQNVWDTPTVFCWPARASIRVAIRIHAPLSERERYALLRMIPK